MAVDAVCENGNRQGRDFLGFGGAMMRTMIALVGTALMAMQLASATAEPRVAAAQMQGGSSTELSAQRRLKRIPIYPHEDGHWQPDVAPHYNPGPNAVRVCNAHYVQEARPSGTVIVPRVNCYWRG
jgi:hypothetical protein